MHTCLKMTTHMQGYFWDGPEPVYEKTMSNRVILTSFLVGPHTNAIQIWCSFCCKVDIKVSWAHHFFPNGTSKFQMAHENFDFCNANAWDMAHWPIFMAH